MWRRGDLRRAFSYCHLHIATAWVSVRRANLLGCSRREPTGCWLSGARMLDGNGRSWNHPSLHKQRDQSTGFSEQFVNKRHSPNMHIRMTDEYAVAACIMIISVRGKNMQAVRHHRVGHTNGLQSIGVAADFVRNVLDAAASGTLYLLNHLKRFAVSCAG